MNRGYVFTILTLYFAIIFVLFLGFTTFFIYKSTNSDSSLFSSFLSFNKFNLSSGNITSADNFYWCSTFFYYDAEKNTVGYNNIDTKTYCEGYNAKRFI